MHKSFLSIVTVGGMILCASCVSQAPQNPHQITVSAGAQDRQQSVVTFKAPDNMPRNPHLRAADGRLIPVQIQNGQASFLLGSLRAGEDAQFELVAAPRQPAPSSVKVEREGSRLKFEVAGKTAFYYQAEPSQPPREDIGAVYRRGGYIHPVLTPSGMTVTDDYPRQHAHHHGIWFAWTNTRFEDRTPDFWNMGQRRGTIEFVKLDEHWSGPAHGGLRAEHRFVDLGAPERKIALKETWEILAYNLDPSTGYWFFDFVSTQECGTDQPLILPEYHYGGIGIRGHEQWNGAASAKFLTSEGISDRVKAHATRARWCQMSGTIDGKAAGIVILDHPDNFRAPQPMRVHPNEPFFCYAPSQLGDWSIQPGTQYVSRYRFVIHDGNLGAETIDRLWNDYARPPAVRVQAAR